MKRFLIEETALTKGSQRVLNDKKLVAGLADALRDDSMTNPAAFPSGFAKSAQKLPDEQLAHWFLENLDKIEKEGYDNVVYSRDGVNSDWIARRYIAGSHSWEDITGVLNMNMRDFYALKNRNLLDANHKDIPKFNSIRELGKYITIHYSSELQDVRNAAKTAALQKQAKSAKLVDNEDYRIYTVFNWAAARVLGLGTQWCTANSTLDNNYNRYSNGGMLFQLYPKNAEEVEKVVAGRQVSGKEKYQFDAGSMSFMDIADERVPANVIKEKFPYLYSDLVSALRSNKTQLEQAMKDMSENPELQKDPVTKIRQVYDIDEQISLLKKFINDGYFTNKDRPAARPDSEQTPQLTQEEFIMEMDKDVKAMLDTLKNYDKMIAESVKKSEVPAVNRKGSGKQDWKMTLADLDKEESESPTSKKGLERLKKEKGITEEVDADVAEWMKRFANQSALSEEKKPDADGDGVPDWADKKPGCDDKEEKECDVKEGVDPVVLEWMKRFDRLGKI